MCSRLPTWEAQFCLFIVSWGMKLAGRLSAPQEELFPAPRRQPRGRQREALRWSSLLHQPVSPSCTFASPLFELMGAGDFICFLIVAQSLSVTLTPLSKFPLLSSYNKGTWRERAERSHHSISHGIFLGLPQQAPCFSSQAHPQKEQSLAVWIHIFLWKNPNPAASPSRCRAGWRLLQKGFGASPGGMQQGSGAGAAAGEPLPLAQGWGSQTLAQEPAWGRGSVIRMKHLFQQGSSATWEEISCLPLGPNNEILSI